MGVKHLKKRQSMLHDEKELLLRQFRKVIKLGGSRGMLRRVILNLRSSEIAGNVYFSVFKVFKEGIKTSSLSYLSNLLINFYFVDTKFVILAN